MATILVVDDEENIRNLVGLYLRAAGLVVETATDGRDALDKFSRHCPDLVILDMMLPDMSGSEVCAQIRGISDTPIIMLTARDSDLDKVGAFETGADDYIVKPFSPPEMVARVRAVLRRSGQPSRPEREAGAGGATIGTMAVSAAVEHTTVRVGALAMDLDSRDVTVDGNPVALTTREFDLLWTMARRPGVIISREQLIDAVSGRADFADVRGVDVHIRHLREKLGDDASNPRFIETVRGVGYRVRRDAS